jgi:YHS domain-containing protein
MKEQLVDAVSGNPIKKGLFADYRGARIYFCCPASKSDFETSPEKHVRLLKAQGVVREESLAG